MKNKNHEDARIVITEQDLNRGYLETLETVDDEENAHITSLQWEGTVKVAAEVVKKLIPKEKEMDLQRQEKSDDEKRYSR